MMSDYPVWEPTLEPTVVVTTGTFSVHGDGTGSMLIKVDGVLYRWDLHPHVVTQVLRIRETFEMPVDYSVRVVEDHYVSPEDKTPWVDVNPHFKRGGSTEGASA